MVNKIDVIILIESMSKRGGTEIVALNLVNALNEHGIVANILSIEDSLLAESEPYIVGISAKEKAEYKLKPQTIFEKIISSRHREKKITRFIKDFCKKHQVETLINFTYENLAVLPFNSGFKTIAVYHWSVIGYEQSLYKIAENKNWFNRILSRYVLTRKYNYLHSLLSKPDMSIALTEHGAEELKLINNDCRVKVIPNFLPYSSPNDSIAPLVQPSHSKVVYVGRLSIEKGVDFLIDIWEIVSKKVPDAWLYIYGEGDERDNMISQLKCRGIDRVIFKGFESNMDAIYDNASLLLCTSRTEGFGMVLIEAMYHGVIPVAFDCPVSPKELIGDAGITVECFNIVEYSNQVVNLLSDYGQLNNFRHKGINRAKDFYKNKVIGQWITLIERNT